MRLIKNVLAIIGLIALVAAGFAYYRAYQLMGELDPQAVQTYRSFADRFMVTKDPASAMVWSVPVDEGLSPDDVKEAMKSLAVRHNFLFVGESPFYKQAEAVTGKPYRHISFMSFCDVQVGMQMADYNDAYTSFMPCRIAIVEDPNGKLALHTLNLDLMIHGGKVLPPELKEGAVKVWDTIQAIMTGAAKGEF